MTTAEEPMARVSISRILEKVTTMEATLAVIGRDIKALRSFTRQEVGDLDGRVRDLEANRFPWKIISALVAVGALAVGMLTYVGSQSGHPPPPPGNSTSR